LPRACTPRSSPASRDGWPTSGPFDFEPGPVDYAQGAARFLHGTPSVPALYAARAGCEIVRSIGVEAIRRKSERQVQLILDLARERGDHAAYAGLAPASAAAWSSSTFLTARP
jgi:kynureninase